jgi:hypothetical protein
MVCGGWGVPCLMGCCVFRELVERRLLVHVFWTICGAVPVTAVQSRTEMQLAAGKRVRIMQGPSAPSA